MNFGNNDVFEKKRKASDICLCLYDVFGLYAFVYACTSQV